MAEIKNIEGGMYDLDEGSYLILVNPEKIPHLVYLQDGRYYSLTYKGIELAYSFFPYLEKLVRAQKKFIVLEMDVIDKSPFQVFSKYLETYEESTCFYPVRDLLAENSKAEMIFELIPELYDLDVIKSARHFGMEDLIDKNGNFKMSEYSLEEIKSYIAKLKSKYVER